MLLESKRAMLLLLLTSVTAGRVMSAAPVTYQIDPDHTYPGFEADHMGLSIWRGKFDKTAGQGTVTAAIDSSRVDFGHDKLNVWATSAEFFDTTKFPQASYTGKLAGFAKGIPSRVVGI